MTTPIVRIQVAGSDLPITTHHLECSVVEGLTDTGRRTIAISARGFSAPDLSAIDWTAPVALSWRDITDADAAWDTLTVWSLGPRVTTDLDGIVAAWTIEGTESAGTTSLLTIGGVTLPHDTHHLACEVTTGYGTGGQRTLRISARGWHAPALSAVDFTGAVTVTWVDRRTGGTTRSLSIRSPGPEITDDLGAMGAAWTLTGTSDSEPGSWAGRVTIGGTVYQAGIAVGPIGGTILRKTSGAGLLLRAWGKKAVRITGRGTPPTVTPGTLAIVSTVWSGTILCTGVSTTVDAETGALTWSLDGEEA